MYGEQLGEYGYCQLGCKELSDEPDVARRRIRRD